MCIVCILSYNTVVLYIRDHEGLHHLTKIEMETSCTILSWHLDSIGYVSKNAFTMTRNASNRLLQNLKKNYSVEFFN